VDIPNQKRVDVALQYIYGVGPATSVKVLAEAGVKPDTRAHALTDDEIKRITLVLTQGEKFPIEGELRRRVQQNIKRLMSINCYRGVRHRKGLPVNGQRTRTNARTRKGPKKILGSSKKPEAPSAA